MVCTRPDLAHSVSIVSRFMANPGKDHRLALKWIFRYLKGSLNLGLRFKGTKDESRTVTGFVDSDFACIIDIGKSLARYIFTLNVIAVSWKAMLQTVVALSTTLRQLKKQYGLRGS
ncbi:secreted RxLR effector protein 161-like [Primulina tabacum]|uniref:secreted RxLR effector protein 161-like n=1 Tax=Primulina tabacum TaxID=48773 RepID=UPI003F59ADFE